MLKFCSKKLSQRGAVYFQRIDVNPNVLNAQYAVRGELVILAEKLKTQLQRDPSSLPFSRITPLNIGNPQSLTPNDWLTWPRQILTVSLTEPKLSSNVIVPSDARERAKQYLASNDGSSGSYTHSLGIPLVRQHVSEFINNRDTAVILPGEAPDSYSNVHSPSNPEHIYLSDGASAAIHHVLNALIRSPNDGIMIPIPQYPLYSAAIALYGGEQIPYYLNEDSNWGINIEEMKQNIANFRKSGKELRALVVINPGNPTGSVLSLQDMKDILQLAKEENLILLADEVYQSNVYSDSFPWYSFRRVRNAIGSDVPLISFHSVSKGLTTECGRRGGYAEFIGCDPDFLEQMYKLWSIGLCANTGGQFVVGSVSKPPVKNEPSFDTFEQETREIFESFRRRSTQLVSTLRTLEGVTSNDVTGAMYVFPKLTLSQKAEEAAKKVDRPADWLYCKEMLENTGICLVPGSGFLQKPGTWHFRGTFLPAESDFPMISNLFQEGHSKFMEKYS